MEAPTEHLPPLGDDTLGRVASRAVKAGWEVEKIENSGERDLRYYPRLILQVPNGRETRRLPINPRRADALSRVQFERFRFLGDFLAINDPAEGTIEVLVVSPRSGPGAITKLPGVELMSRSTEQDDLFSEIELDSAPHENFNDTEKTDIIGPDAEWRLGIKDAQQSWSAEFSRASDEFMALVLDFRVQRGRVGASRNDDEFRPPTLKIMGLATAHHDQAVHALERYAGSLFYEIELRFGLALEPAKRRNSFRTDDVEPDNEEKKPVTLPKVQYPKEALTLYNYARSASGLPLLQFLAYYQVIEFFFPLYSKQNALKLLRQELLDPRFDATSEGDLARLLSISSGIGGFGSEREQLRATIEGIANDQGIRDFIRQRPSLISALSDKKTIKDVPTVNLDHRDSLLDTITSRVYAIRCRIVHTKSDGQNLSQILLPGSKEANALGPDVQLLQYLAQRAITAGATKL